MDYTSNTAARAAGITYRQLDYWTRTDVIRPTRRVANGSGSRRAWTEHDVARLRALAELRTLVPDTAPLASAWRLLATLPLDEWWRHRLLVTTDGSAHLDRMPDGWATTHVVVPLSMCAVLPMNTSELDVDVRELEPVG